jgi:hypothetical protein
MENADQLSNQITGQQNQNQTMTLYTQELMTLDVPEIKDDLMDAKESLARGDKEEALTGVLDLEKIKRIYLKQILKSH